jgi:hypothetical protein
MVVVTLVILLLLDALVIQIKVCHQYKVDQTKVYLVISRTLIKVCLANQLDQIKDSQVILSGLFAAFLVLVGVIFALILRLLLVIQCLLERRLSNIDHNSWRLLGRQEQVL